MRRQPISYVQDARSMRGTEGLTSSQIAGLRRGLLLILALAIPVVLMTHAGDIAPRSEQTIAANPTVTALAKRSDRILSIAQ